MASKTISEYITDLKDNKDLLVDTLVSKGVSADYSMGYTELVALVDDISGGGDIYQVTSVKDLKDISDPQDGSIALIQIYQEPTTETGSIDVDSPDVINTNSITFPQQIDSADLNDFFAVQMTQGTPINVSGIGDSSGSTNLMNITTSNDFTWLQGTITIELTSGIDIVSISYTYTGSAYTPVPGSITGLDNNLTFTSDSLEELNFQNFSIGFGWGSEMTTTGLFKNITYTKTTPGGVIGYSDIYKYDSSNDEWSSFMPKESVICTGILNNTYNTNIPLPISGKSLTNVIDTLYMGDTNLNIVKLYGTSLERDATFYGNNYTMRLIRNFSQSSIKVADLRQSFFDPNFAFNRQYIYTEEQTFGNSDLQHIIFNTDADYTSSDQILSSVRPMGYICYQETFLECSNLESPITLCLPNTTSIIVNNKQSLLSSSSLCQFNGTFINCSNLKYVRVKKSTGDVDLYTTTLGDGYIVFNNTFSLCSSLEVLDLSDIDIYALGNRFRFQDAFGSATAPINLTIYVNSTNSRDYMINNFPCVRNSTFAIGPSDSSIWVDEYFSNN